MTVSLLANEFNVFLKQNLFVLLAEVFIEVVLFKNCFVNEKQSFFLLWKFKSSLKVKLTSISLIGSEGSESQVVTKILSSGGLGNSLGFLATST